MVRWLTLLALSACRFGFSDQSLAMRDADGAPPDELGLSLDAVIISDGIAAAACPTTVLLQDTFDTTGSQPQFNSFTSNGVQVREQGGRFEVVFGATVGAGRYAGYQSASSYTTEGLCAVAQLVAVPSDNALTFVKLKSTQEEVELAIYRGELSIRTRIDNMPVSLLVVPHDVVEHAFLRIRQQAGTTYWDVSRDGVAFTALVEARVLTTATVDFELGAGAFTTSTNAGVAGFESAYLYGP